MTFHGFLLAFGSKQTADLKLFTSTQLFDQVEHRLEVIQMFFTATLPQATSETIEFEEPEAFRDPTPHH